MEFDEVLPEHFSMLSRNPLPHTLIDRALMQLAGGGAEASAFHKKVLVAAGWGHHSLTPFGKHPKDASTAYNRVRDVLRSCDQNPDAILAALENSQP